MIREGTTKDIDELVDIAITAHSKSPYSHIKPDRESIRHAAIMATTMPAMCCFVSEKHNEITGLLVGVVGKNIWGAFVASDQIIYAQSPGDGMKMIDRFFSWAKSVGAEMVSMTNSFGDDRYDRVLEKRYGLTRTGGNFIGEL